MAELYWEGFSADTDLAAVLTVLSTGAAIWWNTRHVARRELMLVQMWAEWHITHRARFVVLWKRDLEALRD
jgi:DNA-binding transcriptional LysR family regulator